MPDRLLWFHEDGELHLTPPTDQRAHGVVSPFAAAGDLGKTLDVLAVWDARGFIVTGDPQNPLGDITPGDLVERLTQLGKMKRLRLMRQCWGLAIHCVEETVAGPPAPSPDDIESTTTEYRVAFTNDDDFILAPPSWTKEHTVRYAASFPDYLGAHIEEQQVIRTKWRRTNV